MKKKKSKSRIEQGEIYFVDLEQTTGKEIQKRRPVVVLSPTKMNDSFPPIVAPITSGGGSARDRGFCVTLHGTGGKVTGVVLCNHIMTLDFEERKSEFIEKLPKELMIEILRKVQAILDIE